MELRQLEYFIAVAEEANFTRAAERVQISQSGVSSQIRQLERELGAELIDRSTRSATLTAAGEAALEHARAAVVSAQAVHQAVGEVTNLIRGRLVIGMVTGCTITPLFDALAAFHVAHPGVEISLTEDTSDRLVDGVRAGAIDLALVGTGHAAPTGLGALTITRERLAAAMPTGHALTKKRRVLLSDVSAYPIVSMPQGTGIRTVFDQACAAQGLRPKIALEASAVGAIVDLATRGLGIAILTESMAANYPDQLHARTIDDVKTPALLALVWTTTKSPALRQLLHHAGAAFAKPQPAR